MHLEQRSIAFGQVHPQFQGESGHAVDPAFAGRYQRNPSARTGHLQGLLTPVAFPSELSIHPHLIVAAQGLKKIQIQSVADPRHTPTEGLPGIGGEQLQGTWPTADQMQLAPLRCKGLACFSDGDRDGTLFTRFGMKDLLGLT